VSMARFVTEVADVDRSTATRVPVAMCKLVMTTFVPVSRVRRAVKAVAVVQSTVTPEHAVTCKLATTMSA
jgi:hypothetical protein